MTEPTPTDAPPVDVPVEAQAPSPSVLQDVQNVAGQAVANAPAIESVVANLPAPAKFKVAALHLAAELHAGMTHLFQHHSLDDLIADARKIEAYLSEELPKL